MRLEENEKVICLDRAVQIECDLRMSDVRDKRRTTERFFARYAIIQILQEIVPGIKDEQIGAHINRTRCAVINARKTRSAMIETDPAYRELEDRIRERLNELLGGVMIQKVRMYGVMRPGGQIDPSTLKYEDYVGSTPVQVIIKHAIR